MKNAETAKSSLRLADFDFHLPTSHIAAVPARPRDASRLLVVDRKQGTWVDSHFRYLHTHLAPGDLLVLNNTRVLKARVFGTLTRTGRTIEILFANPLAEGGWEALLGPGRRVRDGDTIGLSDGTLLEVFGSAAEGLRRVRLDGDEGKKIEDLLPARGEIPLPPYLGRRPTPEDETDYQTTFATQPGAIAAPTAGLHFSPEVFEHLRERGVATTELTLHVGIGTFLPIRTSDPANHPLKPERYEISEATAALLNRARTEGRRIVAVGTTTTRTLEQILARHGRFVAGRGEADLYIRPGHRFQAIEGLVTNFHLPRSTLLLLVSAFASRDLVMRAYDHAIAENYRFYSYGDCTLLI